MGRRVKVPPPPDVDTASASVEPMPSEPDPPLPYECEECETPRSTRYGVCENDACAHAVFPTLTDAGNAERFVERYRDRVRHCAPLGGWLVFDETRWKPDDLGAVIEFGKKVARSIYSEAEYVEDPIAVTRHARASESASRIFAMLRLASSDPAIAITADRFDRDPMLLNTPNGTIDLTTGALRPNLASDFITKITGASFEPRATSPTWDRFLRDSLAEDEEVIALVQRAMGYGATGSTTEERLVLIDGPGGGGKSTFIEAVKSALGSYAMTADFTTFVAARRDGPRNDIARLAGARLVTSIEVEEGSKLAAALVKQLTGGDAVTARFLHREAFEFRPQFTLVLVCNEPPEADDADTGLWRRILRIPFTRPVPKERRDPKLKGKLCDVERSGAAVLAWIVRGCLEWQRIGLAVPESIDAATDAYRAEQDPLSEFWSDECVFDENARTSRGDLRARYEAWAKKQGHAFLIGPRQLAERIRRHAVRDHKLGGDRVWQGIGLKPRVEFGKAEDVRAGAHPHGSAAPNGNGAPSQSAPSAQTAPRDEPGFSEARTPGGTSGHRFGVSSESPPRVTKRNPNGCPKAPQVPQAGDGSNLLLFPTGGRS